jgi:hypothetical protein
MRYYTSIRIAKLKRPVIPSTSHNFIIPVSIWRNWNFDVLLIGIWNGTTTLENSLAVSPTKHIPTIWDSFSKSDYLPKKDESSWAKWVAQACNPSYFGGRDWKDNYPGQPRHELRSYLKNNSQYKTVGGIAQVAGYLPSKWEAQSSIPSTATSPQKKLMKVNVHAKTLFKNNCALLFVIAKNWQGSKCQVNK